MSGAEATVHKENCASYVSEHDPCNIFTSDPLIEINLVMKLL